MVTEFDLLNEEGKVIGRGEIDGDIYRLFPTNKHATACKEYTDLSVMLSESGGHTIQPYLFETQARTRQLNII